MWARLLIPILLAAGNLNKEPCPNKFSKLRWRARMRLPAPHYHWKWPLNACSITNTHPFSVLTPDYFHKWHNEPNAQPSSRKKSFGSGSNMLPTSEIPQNHPKWPNSLKITQNGQKFSVIAPLSRKKFFFFCPRPPHPLHPHHAVISSYTEVNSHAFSPSYRVFRPKNHDFVSHVADRSYVGLYISLLLR